MAAAAAASRAIFCELSPQKSPRPSKESAIPRLRAADPAAAEGGGKIVLQPRLCTLRSYGPGSSAGDGGVIRRRAARDGDDDGEASNFFASLADYIESSRKSEDFEIVSGRLAMVAFAAAVGVESVTGNSLFNKLELQQMMEAAGLCAAVVASAATFAYFSSARSRIGQMLTLSYNQFVDSLIDNLVDRLFWTASSATGPTTCSDLAKTIHQEKE